MKTRFLLLLITFLYPIVYIHAQSLEYATFLGGSKNDGHYNWLKKLSLDDRGTLYFGLSTLSEDFPITDDAIDNSYQGGHVDWGLEDLILVKFSIPQSKLEYATYFGGKTGPEFVSQVLYCESNFYVVGNTGSSDFPVVQSAIDTDFHGPVFRHADGFLVSFEDNQMVNSTYLGTSANESMSNILVNSQGELIVIGQVGNPDELTLDHSFSDERIVDRPNLIVFRLSSDGDEVLSTTLLGPVWDLDATLDAEEHIIITGSTISPNFPMTDDSFDLTFNGGDKGSGGDIFIVKLSPLADKIIFSTFLGGSGDESYPRVCVDEKDNVVVYGITNSTDFPLTKDAIDDQIEGESEFFLSKISSNGKRLLYSSFFGGKQQSKNGQFIGNIVAGENDKIYLCGYTDAENHPVTYDAISQTPFGGTDIFITVFDSSLKEIIYSSYLGGSGAESEPAITLDSNNNIVGICTTNSSDFPISENAFDETINGDRDIAIFKINF